MRIRIADENREAEELLPPKAPDGSGVGANYVDAYLRGLNIELEDGRKVSLKRKGLKILFGVGEAKGESLLRRLEHGPDPRTILARALDAAAASIGCALEIDEGSVFLVEPD